MSRRLFQALVGTTLASSALLAQGTVQITLISVSPASPLWGHQSECVWVTVEVAVSGANIVDKPTLALAVAGYTTTPPEVKVDVQPPDIDATLSGPAAFQFKACSPSKTPGTFTVAAAILGVAPRAKFKVLPPVGLPPTADPKSSLVSPDIRVPIP